MQIWKAIRKIKGKGGLNSINHLKVNGTFLFFGLRLL